MLRLQEGIRDSTSSAGRCVMDQSAILAGVFVQSVAAVNNRPIQSSRTCAKSRTSPHARGLREIAVVERNHYIIHNARPIAWQCLAHEMD